MNVSASNFGEYCKQGMIALWLSTPIHRLLSCFIEIVEVYSTVLYWTISVRHCEIIGNQL